MSQATWRSTGAVLLACAAAMAASSAQAQNASIVVRDADTGQLRAATADEARAIKAGPSGASSATAGSRGVVTGMPTPQQWTLANGSVVSETTDDMMSGLVAVRGKDGKLVRQCAGSLAMANRIVQGKRVSFAKNMLERHDAVR